MKTISNYKFWIGGLLACMMMIACDPVEDNSRSLGGELVNMPNDWSITAVDSSNTVVINFDPLTIIDGINVFAVQFSCPEAGINIAIKDATATTFSQKVYTSGNYTLYVSAITRAGAGTPVEVPFTVSKNLLLEHLGTDVLTGQVSYNITDDAHKETFYTNDLYIENNSIISLTGDLANDDVIVNLDFFERQNTTTVKFVGESGIYSLYWNPVRKNVIIEPSPTSAIAAPYYYVLTGPGIGYPTTVSSEDIIAAYGGVGDGRYTTSWDPGANIRSRVVMRSTGTDTYVATICINDGATFKPFSNTAWGNDVFDAANCTFTGSNILKPSGDWTPNENMDKTAYYRISLNAATKAVDIKKVNSTGEELPDESGGGNTGGTGVDPNTPIVSDKFTTDDAVSQVIKDEQYSVMYYTLEKDKVYTLGGAMANENLLYNMDFFERVSTTTVKFLGENGNYRLYYNHVRRYVLVGIGPDFSKANSPDYMIICGIGLGYPTKTPTSVISFYYSGKDLYTTEWNTNTPMSFILMRKTADNVYQATVFMAPQDWTSYKPFENTSNWWDGGKPYSSLSFSGDNLIQQTGGTDDNWGVTSNVVEQQAYRIIMDLNNNTVTANSIDMP